MICYTVRCSFSESAAGSVADDWLAWLRGKHIQDVLDAGAASARIVVMDDPAFTYEIRYQFADRSVFDAYISNDAPRLRDEGLQKFPLELGLNYSRTVGEVV